MFTLQVLNILTRFHVVITEPHVIQVLVVLTIEGIPYLFARPPAESTEDGPISLREVVFIHQLTDSCLICA